MSIFSMVFASMHLSHALNRGVHHLGRSATFWAVSTPSQASTCVLSASLTFMDVLALLAAAIAARASSSFQRDNRAMAHGSGGQAAPARSKTAYMAIARIDGRRQRHRNVMAPMRIAHCLQDTARLQEPCHGENFPLAWWNARRNRVLQVADGWKAAHRDCAATKRRLRHVWGGRKRP